MTLGDQPAAPIRKGGHFSLFLVRPVLLRKGADNKYSGAEPNWGPSEVEHFESIDPLSQL